MGSGSGEIQETQADKVTRLAKEALDSDDVEATRSFLEEVNKIPDKEKLAKEIQAGQEGPIDSIGHYLSDNPTVSWYDNNHGWQQIKFEGDGKEIRWNPFAEHASGMSNEEIARFEDDPAAEASKIVRLAKKALDSDDIGDTRKFIQAINTARERPYDLAKMIEADQSGPLDGIGHLFSSNPSISWDWDSHPMGRWADEITFKKGDKAVTWRPHLRSESEMTDSDISRYKVDYAELRRQGEEDARQFKLYTREATEEAGELSKLAGVVLRKPDDADAKQELLDALEKTSPLKTSLGVEKYRRRMNEPEIDFSRGAHPMGDWINHVRFNGNGKYIHWEPGDKTIEVKETGTDT